MLVAQGNVVTASLVRELLGVGPAQAIKDVHRLEAALANARLIRLPRINGKGRRYYVYGVALRDK